jgi:hypothetical protein
MSDFWIGYLVGGTFAFIVSWGLPRLIQWLRGGSR